MVTSLKPTPAKATKKIICSTKTTVTVDNKHQEMMNNFNNIENNLIPSLEKEKQNLKKLIKSEQSIEEKLELQDKLKEIKKRISKEKKKKKEYLLQNAKHVFDYFEKKKDLTDGKNKKTILHSFFNKNKEEKSTNEDISYIQKYLTNVDDSFFDINNYIVKQEKCKCSGELISVEHEGVLICKKCGASVCYKKNL